MRIKTFIEEDFINYKEPSMFIGSISCGGKCCIEANIPLSVCQNDELRSTPCLDISNGVLIERYLNNPFTRAIVIGGLEPFEQFDELFMFVKCLRENYICSHDLVIYTGYNKDELTDQLKELAKYRNIIIKFGRYIPNRPNRYDEILGVTLASDNQYAERIS